MESEMKMEVVSSLDDNYHRETLQDHINALTCMDQSKCLESVIFLKNMVIGSNKQKDTIIDLSIVPRILQLLKDDNIKDSLRYEIVATLCSLSKGTKDHLKVIIEAGTVPILIKGIVDPNCKPVFLEISLRTLRSIFSYSFAPMDVIHESKSANSSFITFLLDLAIHSCNWRVQECIANILANSCQTNEHQLNLCQHGAIQAIAHLLLSPAYKVKIPTLNLLSRLCYQNETVSSMVMKASANDQSLSSILINMMSQDNTALMQMTAAKCMTYLYRAGAIKAQDKKIIYKTLPTLIRMCKKDKDPSIRVAAADTLAYLTEIDTDLQKCSSICDHIIPTLSEFFKYQPVYSSATSLTNSDTAADFFSLSDIPCFEDSLPSSNLNLSQEMKQAAFRAFASLGANDEEIRKKIIETDMIMENIKKGLSDSNVKIRLAALRCLHSLSRSVQQLRTSFQDHNIWVSLKDLLNNASDEILILVSSTLCNLLLEFSPSKQHFLDRSAVEMLCNLTKREEPALRLNGVWALMNMSYQTEQNVKIQILTSLTTPQIFHLLSDSDPAIVIKTLGLIRNLLSTKSHIDYIMNSYGKSLIQAVSIILDGEHCADIKEQALCILANIADGDTAKEFLITNEDLLKRLKGYMSNGNVKLQVASVFCISNLIWRDEEGSLERQNRLKELGFKGILKQLLATQEVSLFDRVKTALEQFSQK